MPLEDYKEIVGTLAGITTIGQFFSGVFICKDIAVAKSTKNVQATPFIGGIAMSLLFLRYAYIINDIAMLPVNYMGFTLNTIYTLVFAYYDDKRANLLGTLAKVLLGVLVIIVYTFIEDPKLIEFRYGIITTALMLMLIASPLAQLGEVIKTQSTETLPFPIILSGTVVCFLWYLYGVILGNAFIQFQNLVAFVLSAIQLSLFVIYPSKKAQKPTKKND